jgi:hypothetical protein
VTAQPAAPPAPAARAPSPYDTRLVANVPGEVATRLRLLAALAGRPVGHVLTDLLGRELPTSGQLAAQLQQMSETGAGDEGH